MSDKNLPTKKKKKTHKKFSVVMKTWANGLSKEMSRISWESKSKVVRDFVVVLLLCLFLASIFFCFDLIIISIQ